MIIESVAYAVLSVVKSTMTIPRMRKEMLDAGLSEPVYDTDGILL